MAESITSCSASKDLPSHPSQATGRASYLQLSINYLDNKVTLPILNMHRDQSVMTYDIHGCNFLVHNFLVVLSFHSHIYVLVCITKPYVLFLKEHLELTVTHTWLAYSKVSPRSRLAQCLFWVCWNIYGHWPSKSAWESLEEPDNSIQRCSRCQL